MTVAKIEDIARGSVIVGNASAATAELTIGSNTYVLTSDGTDIAWAAAAGGPDQAAQSDIEAETNENTYVPPDLIRKSPGVAKCYVSVTAAHAAETPNHNISGISDGSTGLNTISVTTDFTTDTYVVVVGKEGNDTVSVHIPESSRGVGSFICNTYAAASLADRDFYVAAFGDQ